MTTLVKRGTTNTVGTTGTTIGTWSNRANITDGTPGVNSGTYAAWNNAVNATGYIEVGGYDFSTVTAPLNSVTIAVRHFDNEPTEFDAASVTWNSGGVYSAPITMTIGNLHTDVVTIPSITLAQLQAADFRVRFTVHAANIAGSRTLNVDFIDVTADYGITGGLMKVWTGSAWVDKPVKVWTGSAWVAKPVKVWNGSAWVLS